jgi:hypothetical protein
LEIPNLSELGLRERYDWLTVPKLVFLVLARPTRIYS